MDIFDRICSGCEYREMTYEPKAEDYGQDGVGYYCNRKEYDVERCPRASLWREYFKQKKEAEDLRLMHS